MGAPSSEQEARDIVRERERMPRAVEVSDRIQQLLDAMPQHDMSDCLRRAQLEGFQLAMAYTFGQGQDISAEEHAEWMKVLA